MSDRRDEIIRAALTERVRQFDLPGSEWDSKNTPNDWMAIIASYVLRNSARKQNVPDAAEFEDDLIKAAAVILAALENVPQMQKAGTLL